MGLISSSVRSKWLFVILSVVVGVALLLAYKLMLDRPDPVMPSAFNSGSYKQIPVSDRCVDAFYDFESEAGPHIKQINRVGSDSLSSVFEFTGAVEYGPTYTSKIKTICEGSRLEKLVFTCDAYASRKDLPAPLVVSIEHDGKSLYWKSTNLPFADAKWETVKLEFDLPEEAIVPEAELKVYIWNNSKHAFMIDNMRIGLVSGGGQNMSYGFYPERYVEYDFDTEIPDRETNLHRGEPSLSGDGSCKLGFFQPFSPIVSRRVGAISEGAPLYVMARAAIHPTFDNPSVSFALSLADSSGAEYYFQSRANDREYKAGEWTALKAKMDLPLEDIKPNDIISVYVWNRGFQKVYVDDFVVQFGESNKRVGRKPAIDVHGYGERGYDFKVNEPPFRKKQLEGIAFSNISNLPTPWSKEFVTTPIHAFDILCSGRFGAGQSKRSQLALFRKQQVFFFEYCPGASSLMTCAAAPTSLLNGFDIRTATCTAADLDADGWDEVIVHQPGSNRFHVVQPDRSVSLPGCNDVSIPVGQRSVKVRDVPLGVRLDDASKQLYAAADLIGDDAIELLFVNARNGTFAMYDINGMLVSKGQDQEFSSDRSDEFLIKPLVLAPGNAKTALAIRKNEQSEFGYFLFDGKGGALAKQQLPGSELLVYTGCDDIAVSSGQSPSVWYFHRTVPKFGMFQTNYAPGSGLKVAYDLDFSGSKGLPKPKYYEKRKLLYGDFTGSGTVELMMISSNCGDSDFRGFHCQRPDLTGGFAPLIQIFKIN